MHLESQRMPPAGLVRPFAIARPAGPGLPFPRAPASVLPSPRPGKANELGVDELPEALGRRASIVMRTVRPVRDSGEADQGERVGGW